jgi:hypothetical protein
LTADVDRRIQPRNGRVKHLNDSAKPLKNHVVTASAQKSLKSWPTALRRSRRTSASYAIVTISIHRNPEFPTLLSTFFTGLFTRVVEIRTRHCAVDARCGRTRCTCPVIGSESGLPQRRRVGTNERKCNADARQALADGCTLES